MAKQIRTKIYIDGLEKAVSSTITLNETLTALIESMNKTEKKSETVESRLKKMKEEMAQMIADGVDPSSDAFKDLQKNAGALERAINEAGETIKIFASRTKSLDQIVSMGNSIKTSFESAQGILTLFGEKSEFLDNAVEKLAAGMKALTGVQSVYNQMTKKGTLENKLYSAGLTVVAKAKTALSAATAAASTGMRVFKIALASTGIGLIIVALGTLIANFDKIKKAVTDTFPSLKNFGAIIDDVKAIAVGVGRLIVEIFTTIGNIISKAMDLDFTGMLEEAKNGFKIVDAYQKGYNEQTIKNARELQKAQSRESAKAVEETIKDNEAKYGADWKYTQEAKKLYQDMYTHQINSLDEGSEAYKEAMRERMSYFREFEEFSSRKGQGGSGGNSSVDRLKEYRDAFESFQSETYRIQIENDQKRIDAAKEASEKMKAVTQEELAARNAAIKAAYSDQEKMDKELAEKEIEAVDAKYAELISAAEKAGQETAALVAAREERIRQLQQSSTFVQIALEKEKAEKIKESTESFYTEQLETQKRHSDLSMRETETQLRQIEEMLAGAQVKQEGGLKLIDVDTTRDNLQKADAMLTEYIEGLKSNRQEVEAYFKASLDNIKNQFGENSIQYKEEVKNMDDALGAIDKSMKDAAKKQENNLKDIGNVGAEYIKEFAGQVEEYVNTISGAIGSIFEAVKSSVDAELEEAQEKYDVISEKHQEAADKVQESNDRIKSLQDEAKNAQGGRLMVVQEQIAREIETRNELANEEKRLEKEKEKAEKEKEKKERKQKKIELGMQLVQAIANTASGVAKAVGASPLTFGLPWSAFVALTGGMQIATITKQISKLEDGGMLNGKRHSQGGMRIEGTNIEVEGGEYVINRMSTQRNLGLVSYINSQRRELMPEDIDGYFASSGSHGRKPAFRTMFAEGGELPSGDTLDTYGDNAVLRAIESINFQPVVSVVDIANVQQSMTQVTEWTNTR